MPEPLPLNARPRRDHLPIASNPDYDVLRLTLSLAVPLVIDELRRMTNEQRERTCRYWAREAAEAVAHQGDVLQFGGKRKGEAAKVFNRLARGLAAGAFLPGGITFAGQRWEVGELPDQPAPAVERAHLAPSRPIVDVFLPEPMEATDG